MDIIKNWSLQMFGEGGEGASTSADGGEGQGVQAAEQGGAPAQEKASFEELLKDADYKREFDNRVRNAVRTRFRANDEERAALRPMYETLGRKYGLDVSDPAKIDLKRLSEAVMADNAMLEQEAADMGVSVDGLRKIRNAERQLDEAKRIREEEASQRAWQQLMDEGERLRGMYPNFDLSVELQNPQFGNLLASLQASGFNDPLRTAYESVHRDEIMGGAMQYAVQRTKQQVSNSIRAGARRPAENGNAAPADTKIDIAHLSKQQREDIRRRVMRGEEITLR